MQYILYVVLLYGALVLFVATYTYFKGFTFPAKGINLNSEAGEIPDALGEEEKQLRRMGFTYVGEEIAEEGMQGNLVSRLYLSPDSITLVFVSLMDIPGLLTQDFYEITSYISPEGYIVTNRSDAPHSSLAKRNSVFRFSISKSHSLEQFLEFHYDLISISEGYGFQFMRLAPSDCGNQHNQVTLEEWGYQKSKGFVKEPVPGYYRFTFKAAFLSAFKFVPPFTAKIQTPDEIRKRLEKSLKKQKLDRLK